MVVALNRSVEHPSQQISRQAAEEKLRPQIVHQSVSGLSYRRKRLRRSVALDKGLSLGTVSPYTRPRNGSHERKEKYRRRKLKMLAAARSMARRHDVVGQFYG